MSNKPKQANLSWSKSDRSVRVPGHRGGKEEQRSLKANLHSPVTKEGPLSGQRRAAFEALDSKKLQREGGVEKALETIENSMAQVRALKAKYREELRYAVAYCYGLAQHFVNDEPAWAAFCEDEFWQDYKGRPTKANRSEALRFVLRWANHTKGKEASKHVSKLHSAVRPFFDEGILAKEIPSKIKEGGGFAKLAAAHVEKQKGAGRADGAQKETTADEQEAEPSGLRGMKVRLIAPKESIQSLKDLRPGSTVDARLTVIRGESGRCSHFAVKLLSKGAAGPTSSERRTSKTRQDKPSPRHGRKDSSQKRRTAR